MRISIPFWLRSPSYRRAIKRRLQPVTVIRNVPPPDWAKSSRRMAELEAEQTVSRRGTHVFVEGHRLLRPRRRAWWLSPAFFAGVASVAVGVILALLQHAATP